MSFRCSEILPRVEWSLSDTNVTHIIRDIPCRHEIPTWIDPCMGFGHRTSLAARIGIVGIRSWWLYWGKYITRKIDYFVQSNHTWNCLLQAAACVHKWLISHRADRLKEAGLEGVLNRVLETGEFDEDRRIYTNNLLNLCNTSIENDPEAFKRKRKEVSGTLYNQHYRW